MLKVTVKRGDWNNQVIVNKTFHLFRGLSMGSKGPFITVNGRYSAMATRSPNSPTRSATS